ncbi:hypothetical protein SAMN05443270_3798 [Lacrimispora sphenoides]|uniref:hypothetical protein n=1 Tax=Lacrimispora sphenoides TaxID=29370 RepID=UPI0008B8ACB9|nr:hypothetical protein [Lacrimispora sphenoides]SEU24455.1 hypothetical protein SAMN05443270_3798 [Lacrimispora sphenoides]
MGVFGIGTNVKRIDSGIIRGTMYPIACMAWYSPGCPPRPLLFKFEGEDGILQTITNLCIKSTDDKCYDGNRATEYRCEAVIGGIRYGFKLIFYIIDNRWGMVI